MIISKTPLRISFAGGGSDLREYYAVKPGKVVSTAIDKHVYVAVNGRYDDLIRVSYSKTEMETNVDNIEHNIVREALKFVGVTKGVEVVYMGDVPLKTIGTGLGSSSSLAVGVLNALYAHTRRQVSPEQLARDACALEIESLGHPMGKQDQYIAAYGGIKSICFNEDESVFVNPVICRQNVLADLNSGLMLFSTGIERFSSEILSEQSKNTPKNMQRLDKMVELADRLESSLVEGNVADFGSMLHEGWLYKKQLASGISNEKIDGYYEAALKGGASGGKVVGAGGGGFLLLYCEEDRQEEVRKALAELKEMTFSFDPQGSRIIHISD